MKIMKDDFIKMGCIFILANILIIYCSIYGWRSFLRNENKTEIISIVNIPKKESLLKHDYLLKINLNKTLQQLIKENKIKKDANGFLTPNSELEFRELKGIEKNIMSIIYFQNVTLDDIESVYLDKFFTKDYEDLLKDKILKKESIDIIYKDKRFSSNEIFFIIMSIIFYMTIVTRTLRDYKKIRDLYKFKKILLNNKEEDYGKLNENIEKLAENSPIKKAWISYKKSFYLKDDNRYETIDSDFFFNFDSLYKEETHYKIFIYIPQLLVGIGMLGTFYGLTSGLSQLDLSNIKVIEIGVGDLLSGVKTAFYTSLFGLGYSIALSILINFYFSEVEKIITVIRKEISNFTKKAIKEDSIDLIIKSLIEIKSSNNDMATKLSNQIENMSEGINKNINNFTSSIGGNFQEELGGVLDKIFTEDFVKNMNISLNTIAEVFFTNAEKMEQFRNEIMDSINHLQHLKDSYSEIIDQTFSLKNAFNMSMTSINEDLKEIVLEVNRVSERYEETSSKLNNILKILDSTQDNSIQLIEENKKVIDVANILINNSREILDAEKSLQNIWNSYDENFKEINIHLSKNLDEYKENMTITMSQLREILKENAEEYNAVIRNQTVDYTNEIKKGLVGLFTDYDQNLSVVINKFNGVLLNFNEKIDKFSDIMIETRETIENYTEKLDLNIKNKKGED